MARDRRYGTAMWQRTRRAILARDGYVCQINGPTCTGNAMAVHHKLPSSQYPQLFHSPDNLVSSCVACNSGEGAAIASSNRADRALVAHLQQLVEQQQAEIDELHRQLAEHERPRPHRVPAIH